MNPKEIVVSTAYLPTIEYFAFIAKSEVFFMEDAETYQKQSYRNRAYIMTAGGVQTLILPVRHETQRSCIRDVRIDYKVNNVIGLNTVDVTLTGTAIKYK